VQRRGDAKPEMWTLEVRQAGAEPGFKLCHLRFCRARGRREYKAGPRYARSCRAHKMRPSPRRSVWLSAGTDRLMEMSRACSRVFATSRAQHFGVRRRSCRFAFAMESVTFGDWGR
jgi:hypothetical protein